MPITVKFFASLREQMGRGEARLDAAAPIPLRQVWEQVADGAAPPANLLVAVNMEYTDFDGTACDGDEVAFFPPVTGGAA